MSDPMSSELVPSALFHKFGKNRIILGQNRLKSLRNSWKSFKIGKKTLDSDQNSVRYNARAISIVCAHVMNSQSNRFIGYFHIELISS